MLDNPLIAFANLKSLEPGTIRDFMSRYGLHMTQEGVETGKDLLAATDKNHGTLYALDAIPADDALLQGMVERVELIPVDSTRYVGLAGYLALSQTECRKFLDDINENGCFDMETVNGIAARFDALSLAFASGGNDVPTSRPTFSPSVNKLLEDIRQIAGHLYRLEHSVGQEELAERLEELAERFENNTISFKPTQYGRLIVNLAPGKLEYIEDFIWFHGLIIPLLHGQAEDLLNTRRCKNCGDHFASKDSRRLFCSDKCRAAHHYANKSSR